MVVFVVFGHVAASYQCAEWPITHHWRSVHVCAYTSICVCADRDGEIKRGIVPSLLRHRGFCV